MDVGLKDVWLFVLWACYSLASLLFAFVAEKHFIAKNTHFFRRLMWVLFAFLLWPLVLCVGFLSVEPDRRE